MDLFEENSVVEKGILANNYEFEDVIFASGSPASFYKKDGHIRKGWFHGNVRKFDVVLKGYILYERDKKGKLEFIESIVAEAFEKGSAEFPEDYVIRFNKKGKIISK